ncbi:MAG: hypothetical protein IKU61_00880 [Clostridia bacterium]|nr:hypothetical protein [Clostridia bacterium]
MDLKKLYRDVTVLCREEIPLNDFLLYCDMAVRTFLAKYPKKYLLPKGQYSSPTSLSDSLMISGEFYNAVLYFVAGNCTLNEKQLELSEDAASNAYIKMWRENARGKHIRGDKW